MEKYDELSLLKEIQIEIPKYIPIIEDVKSYTQYNNKKLKDGVINCFLHFFNTQRNGIHESYVSTCNIIVAIDGENGDLSMIKIGTILSENLPKIQTKNICGILIDNISQPTFDNEKNIWFRFVKIQITWKNNI